MKTPDLSSHHTVNLSPPALLALGFLGLIFIGSLLLMLLMNHVPEIKTLLLKRGSRIDDSPAPDMLLQEGDILVIEGLLEPLRRLSKYFKRL